MKKELIFAIALIFSIQLISATGCNLNATLINQDPYPAIPGDYVKLVFQLSGIENPECNGGKFELIQEYPIIFDPDFSNKIEINSETYVSDYNSYLMIPYKVRVDKEALDGKNPIKVKFSSGDNKIIVINTFDLEIKQAKTNFEVYVKNYNSQTSTITLEVLNTGKNNIEALTIEIPKQDSITVKGPRTNIIGDLDSNEYSTGDFEVIPISDRFSINLKYTDSAGIRREQNYSISYENDLFINRKKDEKTTPIATYLIVLVIIIIVVFYLFKDSVRNPIALARG